jgi:GntR family transcriptional regulator
MDISYNKNSPIPIGVQVKEQIKLLIYSGTYKIGDKLPSINELSASIGVNRNTIVAVLKDLGKEGYVESHKGKGIFVKSKKTNKFLDKELIDKIDQVICEARKKGMGLNELINIISSKYDHINMLNIQKKATALFIMGISQKVVDVNVDKLKENIHGVKFEGLLLNKKVNEEKFCQAVESADLVIVPSVYYDFIKDHVPEGKALIKAEANLKVLDGLKKMVAKKKHKVAVIGANSAGAQSLAGIFASAGLFKPKLVLSLDNLGKCKKELRDIDSLVVCISAKEEVDKLKFKDKNIYYFSDYLDDKSLGNIKSFFKIL